MQTVNATGMKPKRKTIVLESTQQAPQPKAPMTWQIDIYKQKYIHLRSIGNLNLMYGLFITQLPDDIPPPFLKAAEDILLAAMDPNLIPELVNPKPIKEIGLNHLNKALLTTFLIIMK